MSIISDLVAGANPVGQASLAIKWVTIGLISTSVAGGGGYVVYKIREADRLEKEKIELQKAIEVQQNVTNEGIKNNQKAIQNNIITQTKIKEATNSVPLIATKDAVKDINCEFNNFDNLTIGC
jgi:hypothetical protein